MTVRARTRALRFLSALLVYRDVHYARRILRLAGQNLRLVLGSLGSRYIRVRPYEDFGGIRDGGACERYVLGPQPVGLVRVNLIPYHLALPDVAEKVVIDAGTNEGAGAALFASRAAEVYGLDRSEAAIEVARSRHRAPHLHFRVHDLTRPLPFPDRSVDVVFSSEVIEHLPEGRPFVREAARVLRPGGLLLIKTPNDDYNRLENRQNPHHLNPYTTRRLRRELEESFEDVVLDGITYDVELATESEDRASEHPPETVPYRFGEPIWIDRVLVVRMSVTPRRTAGPKSGPPEYLWARATRPRASFASRR